MNFFKLQFRKIHDFARAYGSLCWNLSKVIQRKDLPRIYTMCLPSSSLLGGGSNNTMSSADDSVGFSRTDLENTREDVVKEVINAPKRRLDNEISRVADSASLLHLHISVLNDVLDIHCSSIFKARVLVGIVGLISVGAGVGSWTAVAIGLTGVKSLIGVALTISTSTAVSISMVGGLSTLIIWLWTSRNIKEEARRLLRDDLLGGAAFNRLYARRISEKDESLLSMWTRVRDHMRISGAFNSPGDSLTITAHKFSTSSRRAKLKEIESILDEQIPTLRRRAAPSFNRPV